MSIQNVHAGLSARKRKLPGLREAKRHGRTRKLISPPEAQRQAQQSRREREHHRDRVLTFRQWCGLNGFSKATGLRILRRGDGPPVLQLSARRIGIRESDNAAWQASRVR